MKLMKHRHSKRDSWPTVQVKIISLNTVLPNAGVLGGSCSFVRNFLSLYAEAFGPSIQNEIAVTSA